MPFWKYYLALFHTQNNIFIPLPVLILQKFEVKIQRKFQFFITEHLFSSQFIWNMSWLKLLNRYSTKTFDWVPLLEVLEKEGPQIEGYWQLVRGLFRFHACADNLNFVIIEDLKLSWQLLLPNNENHSVEKRKTGLRQIYMKGGLQHQINGYLFLLQT